MEWLIGGFVVWFIYRVVTVGSRRNKYFTEAIIWKTGGVVGTGVIDIHKAINLLMKASSLGHAQASFELGAIYEDGWSHPTSSHNGAQIAPNEALSSAYFRKCQTQSPEAYSQLKNERKQMQAHVAEHLQRMMQASKNNREHEEEYEDECDDDYNMLVDIILQAYESKGFYETCITWSDAVGIAQNFYNFSERHHHDDLNLGEATFNATLHGNDVYIRITRAKNGDALFIVSDAQEVNDIHQKMLSGDFDPEEYFK